jgi:hypothetical protein
MSENIILDIGCGKINRKIDKSSYSIGIDIHKPYLSISKK